MLLPILSLMLIASSRGLVARKEPACSHLMVGHDCAIRYTFYNPLSEAIRNVQLMEKDLYDLANIVAGYLDVDFPKLGPNEVVQHSIVIRPTNNKYSDALYHLIHESTPVKYELDGETVTIQSSSQLNQQSSESRRYILPEVDSQKFVERLKGSHIQYWLAFICLAGIPNLYSLLGMMSISKHFFNLTEQDNHINPTSLPQKKDQPQNKQQQKKEKKNSKK